MQVEAGEDTGVALLVVNQPLKLLQVLAAYLKVVIVVAKVFVVKHCLRVGVLAGTHVWVEVLPVEGVHDLVHMESYINFGIYFLVHGNVKMVR